jgi:hypothetical protein
MQKSYLKNYMVFRNYTTKQNFVYGLLLTQYVSLVTEDDEFLNI